MLKKMKRKKFSFIKKFIFTILFGISSVCLLGAWSIDNNGNLHSDNEYNGDTQVVVSTGSNWTSKRFDITLTPNTNYTLSYNFSKIGNSVNYVTIYDGTRDVLQMLNITSKTFTTTSQTNYKIYFHASTANGPSEVGTSTYSEIMINKGSTALPYEPYGTWYSQSNYDILEHDISQLNEEIGELEEQLSDLQSRYEDLEIEYQETYDDLQNLQDEYNDLQDEYSNLQLSYDQLQQQYQNLIDSVGTTSFDISQYSVSVGSVPNQPSFDYTLNQSITNNFTNIGYLNVSDIYTNYIQSGNNNSIYITTPQSNLLTFDMTLNFTTQPNTSIKTTLTLPNGDLQQFLYSASDFNYKGEWTLANLVASSTIGANYDINDISYKDVLITWENIGNNLSDIKLGSNNGYNTGFNSGYNTALDRINELTTELNEKTTNLQRVTEELTAKTIQYEHLYTRFQQLSDRPLQLNFQSLLWNIASTPFEVFKTMWNFDFLGFNIAQFVTR